MNANESSAAAQGKISLSNEEAVKKVLVESVHGLWEVVNNLTQLQPSRRDRYRVTIFGSARATPGSFAYEETKRAAAALAKLGCDIVTGGGPGLMQAANEGGSSADGSVQSVGIRIELPFEQNVNSFVNQAFQHRTFFTRLHQFVLTSDAYIVAPGGIGTVLETMMVWQLLQVNHIENAPLILVGPMWPGLVEWAKSTMLAYNPPLASPPDFDIPQCVPDANAAIDLIAKHHQRWSEANRG